MKCSGEPAGCSRCVKRGIPCIYSQQKQMGRPRKRQKMDEETRNLETREPRHSSTQSRSIQPQPYVEPQQETPIDPSLSNIDEDLTSFQNICRGPLAQTIRGQREVDEFSKQFATDNHTISDTNGDINVPVPTSYTQYPTDISQWPDFSSIGALPLPLTTKFRPGPASPTLHTLPSPQSNTTHTYQDPDVDPAALASLPSIPACPCLPNLYLSLSTLSTLSSFPVTQQTIDSLLSAHKTAHSVIYCPVCPREYQSGSQNLMLGSTLLNVLADHWHRIRNTTPEALKKGFSPSSITQPSQPFISVKEGATWRKFIHQIIRAYVFGDASIPKPPAPPPASSDTNSNTVPASPEPSTINQSNPGPKVDRSNTLTFLISALERRQRQWHQLDEPTDEFPDRSACEYQPRHIHHHHPSKPRTGTSATTHDVGGGGDAVNEDHGNGNSANKRQNGDSSSHEPTHQHTEKDGHANGSDRPYVCLLILQHSKDILEVLGADGH